MSDTLDAAWLRDAAYLVVGLVAAVWAVREHRSPDRRARDWWPAYWWISAAFLVAMAGARIGSLEDVVADFGRERARSGGWYDDRRNLQGTVIGAIAMAWLIGVFVAVWRVPPRRRRYLPHALGISTLMAFAAIRMVSFHYVDAVLYRRGIAGVRFVAIIELGLLAATAAVGMATARFARAVPLAEPPASTSAPAPEDERAAVDL